MTMTRFAALLAASSLASACVPRSAAPPLVALPPPPPVVVQAPPPLVAPVPPPPSPAPSASWADAQLTPGRWTYRPAGPRSAALFGPAAAPLFVARCAGGGQLLLSRPGSQASALTFRTSTIARTLSAAMQPDGATAILPANDPLLDALVFSRGRFAVEAPGLPPLIVPAWAELARVVEDCRRAS